LSELDGQYYAPKERQPQFTVLGWIIDESRQEGIMTYRTYGPERERVADMANAGQAPARSASTEVEILEFIGAELASSLSTLSKKFRLSQDELRPKLESLTSRGLLRVQGKVDSSDVVYSITQDGARKLETVRKRVPA
jgi:hypothetical protein